MWLIQSPCIVDTYLLYHIPPTADLDSTGQESSEHLEGVAFMKGTTARASWRLMPNALSPPGESSSLGSSPTMAPIVHVAHCERF